jgi:hypothetical protein
MTISLVTDDRTRVAGNTGLLFLGTINARRGVLYADDVRLSIDGPGRTTTTAAALSTIRISGSLYIAFFVEDY